MSWGYGPDELVVSAWLALAVQGVVLCWVIVHLRRPYRRSWVRAASILGASLAIAGSTALLNAVAPMLGVGVTSGLLTLLVTAPLSLLNGILFAWGGVRSSATARRGLIALTPLVLDLAYWGWLLSGASS